MKWRSWLLLAFFSMLGYGATFFFFPKVVPAAHWGVTLDRDTAVAKAKALADSFGSGKGDWIALTETTFDRQNEYYAQTQRAGLGGDLISAIKMQVVLIDPRTRHKIKVIFHADGRPFWFEDRLLKDDKKNAKVIGPSPTPSVNPPVATSNVMPGSSLIPEADKQLATSAFKSFWGEKLLAASSLTELSKTDQGSRLIWKAEDPQVKLTAKVLVRDGLVKELTLDRSFTKAFEAEFRARRSRATQILSGADLVVIIPIVPLVLIFFFLGLALKRIDHRQGLIFLAAASLLVFLSLVLGRLSDDIREGTDLEGGYWAIVIFPWLVVLLVTLAVACALYGSWAAGQSLAIRLPQRRTVSLELILKGKLLTQPVASSIAVGLLASGVIIAIPILAATAVGKHLFPGIELDAHGLENNLTAHLPAFSAFFAPLQLLLFIVFAFLTPLICVYVKRPLLARAIVFIVCGLSLLGASFVYTSVSGILVTGVLMTLAMTALYFRGDLLATLVSLFAANATLGAATLLAQPSASLQSSGWRTLASMAVLMVVSLVGVWRFREITEEEVAVPAHLLETRMERERLRADFNVAQRAQQQMLPNAPPQIEGLEIAAVCRPSKEVGGDLYDFLPLRDGKLGIAVADVSGKGVPASLYMTLTKGLLTSVAETTDDPGEILREINRHLYEVCRRKTFVTLFLGVIDPATKQLTYARAGHNPTVFRSVARGQTSLLKPKGMGLGLNGGKIFDQSLKVETLQLESNDKLFFYSDGITEAMNSKNEEYGEVRLMEVAAGVDSLAANEARDVVLADVTKFLESNQPQDDQTLVVVKIT
jgi:serine phosphatase RsbU (regulator of sigma subunit)